MLLFCSVDGEREVAKERRAGIGGPKEPQRHREHREARRRILKALGRDLSNRQRLESERENLTLVLSAFISRTIP
jgi:hypothetical protein